MWGWGGGGPQRFLFILNERVLNWIGNLCVYMFKIPCRFMKLFKVQPKWTFDEIQPYIK